MSFHLKVILTFVGVLVLAVAAMFLLRSSEEEKIMKLLEEGVAAASRKDPEGVIQWVSLEYRNENEDYDAVTKRIRQKVSAADTPPLHLLGAAITLDGEEAVALVTIEARLGPYKGGKMRLHLKLGKEEGEWRITWAEWIR